MRMILFVLALSATFLLVEPTNVNANSQDDCGPKYAVIVHDHEMFQELKRYTCWVGPEDRKQVVSLRRTVRFESLSPKIKQALKPFYPAMLEGYIPKIRRSTPDRDVTRITGEITAESFEAMLKQVLSFGVRRGDPEKNKFRVWAIQYLVGLGYAVSNDYNVIAVKKGKTDEMVVTIGHFDTVQTVGADDNASGAAGVLELARVLSETNPEKTLVFILSNDEEKGLLGAKDFVKNLIEKGEKAKVLFAVNMDMIAYNSNKIVDLETSESFKDLAQWMAEQTATYTKLTPKIVLNPWGSDHVPFIDAGIPALLTIENWDTHTPCWHKVCDKIETVNFEYAAQVLKLNAAALSMKSGAVSVR